jgi:hypothetical protein
MGGFTAVPSRILHTADRSFRYYAGIGNHVAGNDIAT